jgi:hypothetical protein
MRAKPEERYEVSFTVVLIWQEKNGATLRAAGVCVDLSPSRAKLETLDRLAPRSTVMVHSEQFGRMGSASIRYCTRHGMKYSVGLQFSTAFVLSDPIRKNVLKHVLREGPGTGE